MSEKDRENTKGEDAQDKPFEWWQKYAGKAVFIQFREGLSWIGVTAPNIPVTNPEGNPVAVPFIKGELIVEGSGQDCRIGIVGDDPNPANPNVKLRIFFHPDDATFVTVVEQGLISS